ncbi:hypothetical protein NN561_006939 [Cricetulus griseus]
MKSRKLGDVTVSWRGWEEVGDVSEARVNNASSSGQRRAGKAQGVRWEVRSADSASQVPPGPQNKLCNRLSQEGFQRRAGTDCGSVLRCGRTAAGPGLRPGGRRSPQLPTLGRGCGPAPKGGLSAEMELGGSRES